VQVNQLLYTFWQDNGVNILAIFGVPPAFLAINITPSRPLGTSPLWRACYIIIKCNGCAAWYAGICVLPILSVRFFASASMIILIGLVTLFGYGAEALLMLDKISSGYCVNYV
jgi:hypothetical protein